MKNKYCKRAHISEKKFRGLVRLFSLDIEAKKVAEILGVNRNTVNRYFMKIREKIVEHTEKRTADSGVFEVDESYFGARRVRGKRGRGAHGKTIVFGLLKRDGKVYTQVIEKASRAEIMPIIKGKVLDGSTICSDGWKSYDSLITEGYKHYRIYHSKDQFARGKNHINGIESFWAFAKLRLSKFRGMAKKHFFLHLKECEFRFNCRHENIYYTLLHLLRNNPLN